MQRRTCCGRAACCSVCPGRTGGWRMQLVLSGLAHCLQMPERDVTGEALPPTGAMQRTGFRDSPRPCAVHVMNSVAPAGGAPHLSLWSMMNSTLFSPSVSYRGTHASACLHTHVSSAAGTGSAAGGSRLGHTCCRPAHAHAGSQPARLGPHSSGRAGSSSRTGVVGTPRACGG